MSITRRLFARALPALPIAMKAAASAGVSDGVGLGQSLGYVGGEGSLAGASPDYENHLAYLKGELARLVERRGERVAELMRRVTRLDPDIASNRSFSLATRIRLQAERDEARDFEQTRASYTRQIADYAKKVML